MKGIITFLLCLISLNVAAQLMAFNKTKESTFYLPSSDIVLISYYDYGFGLGLSYDRAYANLKRHDSHPGLNFNVTYNFTPFTTLGVEFQGGTFSGGGRTIDKDAYGKYFKNKYKAMVVHSDLLFGQFINYSNSDILHVMKDCFIGIAVGALGNNIVDIQRTNIIKANGSTDYVFPGTDASLNPLIGIRFGYDFKINNFFDEPRYHITIGYQYNVAFGEGLDGYNDNPKIFKNNASDQYGQFMLVFRMDFGETSVYNKFENSRY